MKKKLVAAVILVAVLTALFIALKITGSCPLERRGTGNASISALLTLAKNLEAKGDYLNAKVTYQKLVNDFPGARDVLNWQRKTEELNMRLLFSPALTPKAALYEIKPGDTLTKIAKEFNTTADLIRKSNNLSNDKIMPGRKIKVWTAPFSMLVYKAQNMLVLKTDDEIVKTYTVSTGKNNSTPTGTFKITSKLINPTWFKSGAVIAAGSPENALGSRWMGFDLAGYGIHGTTDPQSLGKQVTEGCVRLSNPDVEELYTIVPVGTEVTVLD